MTGATDRGRCPPAPPPGIAVPLLTADLAANPDELVRLHWRGKAPLCFAISVKGNRFDPLGTPYANTEVLYAGTTLEVAIAETILRWHGQVLPGAPLELSNAVHLADRQVARFRPTRPLTVIDATGPGLARIEQAIAQTMALPEHRSDWARKPSPVADDIFQCPVSDYPATQAWAAWFRTQCPTADGLQWVSRQFNRGCCLVLFGDRCAANLVPVGRSVDLLAPGSLEEKSLDDLLDQIGWHRS